MTKLIIIRHGQTAFNAHGKVQGHTDQPLSTEGKEQAELLGQRLKEETIDVAYTSLLQRAYHTAEAVTQHHPDTILHKVKELNEMDWGSFEGLTFYEVDQQYPGWLEQREKDKFNTAAPKGESPKDVLDRIKPFIEKTIRENQDKTVLIVAHNGVNRLLVGHLLGWSEEKMMETAFDNTAVNVIDVKEDPNLHTFNCTKHLG